MSDDDERRSYASQGGGSSYDGEVISETDLLRLSADADDDGGSESSPKLSDPFDNAEGVQNPFSSFGEDDELRHPWLQDFGQKKSSPPTISKIPKNATVDADKKDKDPKDMKPTGPDPASKDTKPTGSEPALTDTKPTGSEPALTDTKPTESAPLDKNSGGALNSTIGLDIATPEVANKTALSTIIENVDTDSNEGNATNNSATSIHDEEAEADNTAPISIDQGGKIRTGSKEPEEETWKEDIRVAIRESQQSIIDLPPRTDEDKYYKIRVIVPRVTKSYYDDARFRNEEGKGLRTKSDSALNNKHGHGGSHRPTQEDYDQCVQQQTRGRQPKLAPTQARISLAPVKVKHSTVPGHSIVPSRASRAGSHSDFSLPHPSQSRHTVAHEEEILSYFDPEMVQPAYKQLLERSRNIVIGPPKEILRQYFGYTRLDPMPHELRNDNTPKAFILPRNMWKDFDDITKKKEVEMYASKEHRFSQISLGSLDNGDRPLIASASGSKHKHSKPTPSAVSHQKKKKVGNDVLFSESQQKQLLNPKNPLDFFKQSTMKMHTDDTGDPRSYERIRTKCERKKRRENSFDEDVRDRESEYKVVCGSGSSSGTLSIGGILEDPKSVASTKVPSRISTMKPSEISKEPQTRSSLFNYVDRDGSDLSIELGPDPMKRLPREASEFKYYKSHPTYPTISNENFYEWYKDLNRLHNPFAPRSRRAPSSGILKDHEGHVCIPPTSTTHSFLSKRPAFTSSGYLGHHERPHDDARDYVYDNARLISIMPPKIPVPRYVDDRNGTTHLLEPSGLLHKYVHRDDFAKMPNYLMFRNEELGRPAYPNFNKFYSFHRCKYKHGHIHCKCCNRVYPTRGGEGDWECDMLNEDEFGDYSGDVKVNASHSHSRLEDSYSGTYKHFHPTDRGQSMWSLGKDTYKTRSHPSKFSKGRGIDDNGDPVSHMVSRISQLLSKEDASNKSQSRTAARSHYRNPNYDPSSTTYQFPSGTSAYGPTSPTTHCPTGYTSGSDFDLISTSAYSPSSTTNHGYSSTSKYHPSGTTYGIPSASGAGQSGQNLYVVSTHPDSLHNLEGSCGGSTGSFGFHPVSSNHP